MFTKDQDTPLDSLSNIASPSSDSNDTEEDNNNNDVDENLEIEVAENVEPVRETNRQGVSSVRLLLKCHFIKMKLRNIMHYAFA